MEIKKVAVIGAGDMGHGIAELFAINGFDVSLMDKFPDMLEKGKSRIAASVAKLVERGKITQDVAKAALSRLSYFGDMAKAVEGADLIVEAVPESLNLKKSVFKEASEHASPEAIYASNTSNIRITDLAGAVPRPDRMVGMHFFNPPMVMKLVEVYRAPRQTRQWWTRWPKSAGSSEGRR